MKSFRNLLKRFPAAALGAALSVAVLSALPAAPLAAQSAGADLESTVKRLSRIGSCSSPSFSPDGERLAFLSDLSGLPQVWTVDADGGWPTQVTALEASLEAARAQVDLAQSVLDEGIEAERATAAAALEGAQAALDKT
ncbi:MAG: hypothetical protein AAGF23_26425, partial [Acidobacteriota bacterium]